ncbi:MAG: glycosyltransferase family 9 protein [Deltaproteobacteria bacterium]
MLIVKLSSIGDVIHTLPSLYALRKGFEKKGVEARIDWLVEEAAGGILQGHPMIDDLIVVKRGWTKNIKENLSAAGRLKSRRYDMVLDFQGLLKSGVWMRLLNGVRKIGFSNAREFSHIFLNEKIPPYDPEKHAVERYLDLTRYALGSKVVLQEVVFPLNLTVGDRKNVLSILKSNGVPKDALFFVIIPRARWATKLWSDERFIELGKKIVDKNGLYAVLAGTESDRAALDAIKAGIGDKAVNLAGSTGLKDLAQLFRLSRFAITVDSGPMHIAAAAGARVIALFGPTAPWRTGPYGNGHVVLRKGLECSPCFKKRCPDVKCMKGISVEEVFDAVTGVLRIREK